MEMLLCPFETLGGSLFGSLKIDLILFIQMMMLPPVAGNKASVSSVVVHSDRGCCFFLSAVCTDLVLSSIVIE